MTKGNKKPFFAFECDAWKASIKHTISLTRVLRQKDNSSCFCIWASVGTHFLIEFVQLLNELRQGSISPLAIESFRALSRPITSNAVLPPTELFSTRLEVDRANSAYLSSLQSPPVTFDARDSGSATPSRRNVALASMRVPERLILKLGAQVMLVKNFDDQLVNGAVGRVVGLLLLPATSRRA